MNRWRFTGHSKHGLVRSESASSTATHEDRALLTRVALKDRAAMKSLYEQYFLRLQRFALRITHNAELAEEVVNDTMMVVWDHAGDYRGESQPSTWIFGIAYRRALKLLQSQSVRPSLCGGADELDNSSQHATIADDASTERSDWIESGLRGLSPEQRLVVELTYFLGLSCEEVAAIAACPIGTVKTRLFHSRLRLRGLLELSAEPHGPSAGTGSRQP